jgi:hypothetical protein
MPDHRADDPHALSTDEIAAQDAAELPTREALTLIDPGLVGGVGGDPLATADQTSADAAQSAGQSTAGAADLGSQATQDATQTAASQDSTLPYQPAVTRVARS